MRVLAHQAEGDFVGDGLADQTRAGVEQVLHAARRAVGLDVRARPVGIAAAGHVALDIEKILRREGQPLQGPGRGAVDGDQAVRNEGAKPVAGREILRGHAVPLLNAVVNS